MPSQLAQHLIARGLLPPDRVEEALRNQAIAGGTLDTALLEQGLLAEAGMLQALGDVSGHRPVNLADFEANADVASFIPAKVADRMGLVPLSLDGTVLHVASAYPVPTKELQEIGFLLNKQLEVWVAIEVRIRDWLQTVYKTPLPPRYGSLLALLDPTRPLPEKRPSENARVPETRTETVIVVEELEEGLSTEMVENLARSVIDEPIPLNVKKAPKPGASNPPAPEVRPPEAETARAPEAASATVSAAVPAAVSAGASAAATAPAGQAPVPATRPEPGPLRDTEAVPPGVPAWTLAEAKEALHAASNDREAIIEVTLQYARRTFEVAAAFAVMHGNAMGWAVRGEDVDPVAMGQLSIPLDTPSVFRAVSLSRANFVGPTPQDPVTQEFLAQMGRSPRTVFLFPIEVKTRLVAILYGDCGAKPLSQKRLADFLLFCRELAPAFTELIVNRKARTPASGDGPSKPAAPARPAPPAAAARVPSLMPRGGNRPAMGVMPSESSAPAENPPAKARQGFGWGATSASEGTTGRGRAAGMSVPMFDATRPPTDFAPLLRKLTGNDATARTRAIAELAQTPQASARFLAGQFPGPSGWAKRPVQELPEPHELGPIPSAMARLGRESAEALASLLKSQDDLTRYLATLTAGSLAFPELLEAVFAALFDDDPDVVSAARVAVPSFKRLNRFELLLQNLRQELLSKDGLRASQAAGALGALHDRDSVEGLIRLTASVDDSVAQAAADALRVVTKQLFGTDAPAWKAWWAENQSKRRADWLVAALRHEESDLRATAIDELAHAYSDNLGYSAEASASEREAAVRRWEALLQDTGRRHPAL